MSRTTGAPGTELGGVGVVMFRVMSACGENKLLFMKQRWLFVYYFFYKASSLKQWSTNMTMKVPRKSLQLLDIFFHKIGRTDVLFPPLCPTFCLFRHDFWWYFMRSLASWHSLSAYFWAWIFRNNYWHYMPKPESAPVDEKTGLKDQIQSIKGRQFSKTWMI